MYLHSHIAMWLYGKLNAIAIASYICRYASSLASIVIRMAIAI